MSRPMIGALRAVTFAALAAAAVVPASASAAPLKAKYLCDLPAVGQVPLDLVLETISPSEWPAGRPTGPLNATLRGSWPAGAFRGASQLQWVDVPGEIGPARRAAQITNPLYQGNTNSGSNVLAGLSAPTQTVGAGPLPFTASGSINSTTFNTAGAAGLRAGEIALNLALVQADGSRIEVEPTIRDKDIDNDRSTFEVYCDPAGPTDPVLGANGQPTGEFYPEQDLRWVKLNVVDGPTEPRVFSLSGELSIPGLLRSASAKVNGSATVSQVGGQISATLPLRTDRLRLKVIGTIPVTGDVSLIPSGNASGTLVGRDLELTGQYRVRLGQVYLFGSVPIAGAGTCQSKRVSEIKLTSENFSPEVGGDFAGKFDLSDLAGCGAYNGVITPLVSSSGNTLSLSATPSDIPAPPVQ